MTGNDRLCRVGGGVLPLADVLDLLLAGRYDGYYTLEWEKKWHPYLAEADVAFPGFARMMRRFKAQLDGAKQSP